MNINHENFESLYKVELNPEQALWKAVILQAFVDLKNNSKKKITKTHKLKSALWFNINNENFVMVCDYADLNAGYVYKFAEKIKDGFYEPINSQHNNVTAGTYLLNST
jgi:uncharacterized membrane protein